MAKFCSECGAKLGDSVKFCPECGTKIAEAATKITETTAKLSNAELQKKLGWSDTTVTLLNKIMKFDLKTLGSKEIEKLVIGMFEKPETFKLVREYFADNPKALENLNWIEKLKTDDSDDDEAEDEDNSDSDENDDSNDEEYDDKIFDINDFNEEDEEGCCKKRLEGICKDIDGELVIPQCVQIIGNTVYDEDDIEEGMCGSPKGVTSLVLPKSLEVIERDAFKLCENLEEVTFKGTVDEWHEIEHHMCWLPDNGNIKKIICTDGKVKVLPYERDPEWEFDEDEEDEAALDILEAMVGKKGAKAFIDMLSDLGLTVADVNKVPITVVKVCTELKDGFESRVGKAGWDVLYAASRSNIHAFLNMRKVCKIINNASK